MVTVETTEWIRLKKSNPNRKRLLVRNITAAGDVYLHYSAQSTSDTLGSVFKLIGIDEVEYLHYKGELWALAQTASCDVRVLEE